jgi:hypothetical protein
MSMGRRAGLAQSEPLGHSAEKMITTEEFVVFWN